MSCHRIHQNAPRRKAGFALVVALGLMAFVLTLLLSMTLLIQVETTTSSGALAQLKARESARLALMIAIGELQKHGGPDQRVTARAEILGDGNYANAARFWTGIWDTSNPTADPTWLVSGDPSDPATLPVDLMQLVGPGSAGADTAQYVSAPIVEVLSNANTSAQIAWWISDEGVKASAGELPLHLRPKPNYIKDNSTTALVTMLSTSAGLEEVFQDYDRFSSNAASAMDQVTTLDQLLGQPGFADEDTRSLSGESVFHSVTPYSFGVLASVLPGTNGGLMRDLSLFPQLLGSEFEEIMDRAVARAEANSNAANSIERLSNYTSLRGLDDLGTLNDGDLAEPITPILSNLMMAFTIRSHSPVSSNPNFQLRMRFFCEFWNPYTSGILMKTPGGNNMDLELEITGLPAVAVEKVSTGEQSAPIDIQELLRDPANADNATVIRLIYDQTEPWLPGQSKNWTGVDASTATAASPYESILTDSKLWNITSHNLGGSKGIDTNVPRFTSDIRHVSSETNLLKLRVYARDQATGTRTLLSELDGLEYEPVSTRPSGYGNTHSGTTFGYHFILRGPHFSSGDPEYYRGLWLYDHDPRNPKPSIRTDWYLDNDRSSSLGSPYVPIKDGISPLILPDPAEINETNDTINTVVFRRVWDRSIGPASSGNSFHKLWQDAPLFELLRERPLSIASLQHLYFHDERPNKVGNSWGDEGAINTLEWFDRYYFSGFSRSDNPSAYDANKTLPNPLLLNYSLTDPESELTALQAASSDDNSVSTQLAEKVLIANRFNLNSTSIAAWKAVLGGLRFNDWEYLNYPDDTSNLSSITIEEDTRARVFSRFSQSMSETYDAPKPPDFIGTEPVAPSAYYRRGARHFDAAEIEALATEITRLIKQRGEPFYSMEEFLSTTTGTNASLMETAIATILAPTGRQKWDHQWETENVRGPATDIIDVDHFSPGFLTQADIMTAIGPMLSPRSDTFKIRAYGRSLNALGANEGSAAIEAIFQRTPKPAVDSTATIGPMDRQFQIISMRWLTEDEL